MESLSNVDRYEIDAVLHGTASQQGEVGFHLAAVGVGYLGGLQSQFAAALKVDETMGTGIVVEVYLVGVVDGMEEDDLVAVVAQMSQSIEEGLLVVGTQDGVGEEDHERTSMELLGEDVE